MRAWSAEHIRAGRRIGLVPTMGYLHPGHVSLVAGARQRADRVVASIFVNPTQFGPQEDLARYPRDLEGDLAKLAPAGVDVVFTPSAEELYPPGFDCYVVPQEMSTVLCGASRPTHFRGVCTVVLLLFRITRADVAVFGEKDFQQLQILRRMARDLWLDVQVVGMPIVREPDGLAMSSRNVYLSASERHEAVCLSRALAAVRTAFAKGERQSAALLAVAHRVLEQTPGVRLDYCALADQATLQPTTVVTQPAICAIAAYVGRTRLIDNQQLLF